MKRPNYGWRFWINREMAFCAFSGLLWAAGMISLGLLLGVAAAQEKPRCGRGDNTAAYDPRLCRAESAVAVRWENGWKNDRVIATRYQNPAVGYNVGFRFPLNPHNYDSDGLDYLAKLGCKVYHMDGGPGGEVFALCKGITDKASADAKLPAMLASLSKALNRQAGTTFLMNDSDPAVLPPQRRMRE